VKPSYQESSLLNGRDCQKFLTFVFDHPEKNIKFRQTLLCIHKISQYAIANELSQEFINRLPETLREFSRTWRDDKLPAINKLHLFEAHLFDFIQRHRSWGTFGEQGKVAQTGF
jgi:hypothetical protein